MKLLGEAGNFELFISRPRRFLPCKKIHELFPELPTLYLIRVSLWPRSAVVLLGLDHADDTGIVMRRTDAKGA